MTNQEVREYMVQLDDLRRAYRQLEMQAEICKDLGAEKIFFRELEELGHLAHLAKIFCAAYDKFSKKD